MPFFLPERRESVTRIMPGLFSVRKTNLARLRVLRSLFIAELSPVCRQSDVEKAVACAGRRYPDARHQPYAYRIMRDGEIIEHSADDGEPSGTAGRPVLDVLRRAAMANVILVVTRYFGGRKLGTKQLRHSFTEVAERVLDTAVRTELTPIRVVEASVSLEMLGRVSQAIGRFGGKIEDQEYGERVILRASFKSKQIPEVVEYLRGVLKDLGEVRLLEGESYAST